jgi:hypothetical protein
MALYAGNTHIPLVGTAYGRVDKIWLPAGRYGKSGNEPLEQNKAS